ncbi:activator-dependent family glycosyltransferase [Actinosynnema sp. NPDC023587]|uniref:activator-dependent family glycosyltransferase n=1 Tax=Actinosynnema sp. NPDC023587 TaxID=3154695 RepID=UPI00340C06E7
MRVLFTTYSDKSLFLSTVPLAWALRAAGHDVRVAAPRGLTEVITSAGLTAVPVGRDDGIIRILEEDPQAQADLRPGLPSPYDVVDRPDVSWAELSEGFGEQVTWWHKMVNTPMIPQLVEFARHWRPDLVIWEPNTYAGAVAARAVGAAHGRLLWSMDVFGVARDRYTRLRPAGEPDVLADWLDGYARRHGGAFGEDLAVGQFTLTQLPPSLSVRADVRYVPVRYVPYGGPAVVPDWLREPPARRRIALTLGVTSAERFGGYTFGVGEVLESLADLDVEVVATIADRERHRVPQVPANTRVVPWVPLQALVSTCDAVVHHAGPGTLSTTALAAVPQLALPWHFDEPSLAARLAAQGAGLMVHSDDASGAVVRARVETLVTEPGYRERATALRDEMVAMPTPHDVVRTLVELVEEHRAVPVG